MDENFSEAVRDFRLDIEIGKDPRRLSQLIHDPELPPWAPPRRESWERDQNPIGKGGQGEVYIQTCGDGPQRGKQRALKVVRYCDSTSRRRYVRELETMVRFSHQRVNNTQSLPIFVTNS